MPAIERSSLHVEGNDDAHAIRHLLRRHGIECPIKGGKSPTNALEPHAPEIRCAGDKQAVLDAMQPAIQVSNGRSVGFVLDADAEPQDRWRSVCAQLSELGMKLPKDIPSEGFVDEAPVFRARVGVWLMPDNRQSGALEQFLQDLVDEQNALLPLAKTSTTNAKKKGASFPDVKRPKAVLHTWLAWQEKPGLPYGTAIRAKYFQHDSPAAQAFVGWYRNVFVGN
ncbi:MAG: hypothetical protein F4Z95_12150 [Gammaproteobacteria bacterium]|nr:hypothetical protein [Gammaproteobacteria bacterium]